jgi:hypothetical protein
LLHHLGGLTGCHCSAPTAQQVRAHMSHNKAQLANVMKYGIGIRCCTASSQSQPPPAPHKHMLANNT